MRITTNGAAMPVRGPPAGAGIVRAGTRGWADSYGASNFLNLGKRCHAYVAGLATGHPDLHAVQLFTTTTTRRTPVGPGGPTWAWAPAPRIVLEPELGGQHHFAAGDQRSLEGAVSAGGRRYRAVDRTHSARGAVRHRVCKMRVVEQVISAGADGKPNSLGNGDVLIQGRVDVEIAWAKQRVAADIAETRFRTRGQEIRLGHAGRSSVDGGGSAGMRKACNGGSQDGVEYGAPADIAREIVVRNAFRNSGPQVKLAG